jgi:hypothetical protein
MNAKDSVKAQEGMITAAEWKETYDEMKEKIKRMQQNVLNREGFKKNPQLKKGDRVYVLTKNFGTRRSTKKLDYVKVGPFLI